MGSAPNRTSAVDRLRSSVRRGSWVGPGMPGVYGIRKRRPVPIAFVPTNPWIQGPDYTITFTFVTTSVQDSPVIDIDADANPFRVSDIDDTTLALYAGEGTAPFDTPTLSGAPAEETSGIQSWQIGRNTDAPDEDVISGRAQSLPQVVAGADLIDLSNGFVFGTYVPPTDPPGADTLEFEGIVGRIVGDLTFDGEYSTSVGNAGTGSTTPGGSIVYSTNGPNDAFRPQSELITYPELVSFIDTPTSTPFSGTIPSVDVFPVDDDPSIISLWLWPLTEGLSNPGTGHRLVANGLVVNYEVVVTGATITATIRPPRYRVVTVPTTDWIPAEDWSGYVWDAGLYLGADFTDLTSFTMTCPASAGRLDFYVVPDDASDFVAAVYSEPYCDAFVNKFGGSGSDIQPPASTPDAGSHLWAVWFPFNFDFFGDPPPDVTPQSVVPASLAADGEA